MINVRLGKLIMKNNTVSRYLMVSASILMLAYQPMAQADWRDWITRKNMTNMIWSKYGALGGTFVIMAMAAGLWGKSIWNAIRTPSNQNVQPQVQRSPIVATVEQLVEQLDTIYVNQWPNLKNFHTFIISLLDDANVKAKDQLIQLINTINPTPQTTELRSAAKNLCHILVIEHNALNDLIHRKKFRVSSELSEENKKITEASNLIKTLIPSSVVELATKYQTELATSGTIEQCINALDILYTLERENKTFYNVMRTGIQSQKGIGTGLKGKQKINSKNDLIQLFTVKNRAAYDYLETESEYITKHQITNTTLISSILNRLIKLTKPAEETKEAAAAGETGD